jgi:hypothetical protein
MLLEIFTSFSFFNFGSQSAEFLVVVVQGCEKYELMDKKCTEIGRKWWDGEKILAKSKQCR